MTGHPPRVYWRADTGTWTTDIYLRVPGRRKKRRLRKALRNARSESDARALATILQDRLTRHLRTTGDRKPDITFREFVEDVFLPARQRRWKQSTWRGYEQILRVHLLPRFGDEILARITATDIETYMTAKLTAEKPVSGSTVNKHRSLLSVIFGHALRRKYIVSDPTADVDPEPVTVDRSQYPCFTEDELRRFVETAERERPTWYALFYTWARTGCRLGELAALKWSDVDLDGAVLNINRSISAGVEGTTKGGRARKIPMDQEFVDVLRRHRPTRNDGRMFVSNDGRDLNHNRVKSTYRTLLRASGVPPIRFHDGRHTFASHLADHDVGETKISDLLGHADGRTTKRYLHTRTEDLREAVSRLKPLRSTHGSSPKKPSGE